ncbi:MULTISPECIES: methanogenesis marker 7 protein [unclassified Methanobrevibacter]|uniref:methanogenesis marker 7 protein n=1 Tax=unclassified Methanobrevibacter TaxID=2638681 RepID=UPI001DA3F7D4|nr:MULTISPECIES: methanogenesis marker 7 protein [unclassified Methanobrevibacter]MBE6492630.1 methanogenesis marker 7 protein [Methanobrevibacter sp.]MEE0943112.1 methanogenesis marker 7 protein [Methanobrevibacter sp.]
MYESLTFTGGVHKSEEIKELIEDLGGFILQESIQQMELVLNIAIPIEDVDKIEDKSRELLAKLSVAPMAGSEIAIVSPTLARHHLPHAACDISEYLREFGAKDNMIGLARGDGKGTSGITEEEKRLIEEHDIAVFALGSFENCIKEKAFLYDDIDIPVIVTGAPDISVDELPGADAYVGGLGRIPRRLRRGPDIRALDKLVETIEQILSDRKREMALDAPLVPSIVVKNAIENQVSEIKDVISPTPVTSQLDGVRVKLNYDKYADLIADVVIDGKKLSELAEIKKSFMYDYILVKINSESSLVEDSN